jgi:hypothetical protein
MSNASLETALTVMAVDPGGTTGIVIWRADWPLKEARRLELGPEVHHKQLWHLMYDEEPDIIVCERFEYQIRKSGGTEMPGVVLQSRNYIGIIELYCQLNPVPLVMQPTSVVAKKQGALWTDKKLKALGLYHAPQGRQHMNDAMRHLLQYAVVTCWRTDLIQALRPDGS